MSIVMDEDIKAGAACPKKIGVSVGRGRDLMVTIQQGLREDGFTVSMVKLYRWCGLRVGRCTPSVAAVPDQRWSTDLRRIRAGVMVS